MREIVGWDSGYSQGSVVVGMAWVDRCRVEIAIVASLTEFRSTRSRPSADTWTRIDETSLYYCIAYYTIYYRLRFKAAPWRIGFFVHVIYTQVEFSVRKLMGMQ